MDKDKEINGSPSLVWTLENHCEPYTGPESLNARVSFPMGSISLVTNRIDAFMEQSFILLYFDIFV